MAISGSIYSKVESGISVVAPTATYTKTNNIDAPTNTKNAVWAGNRGTYGPNIFGVGATQVITSGVVNHIF